MILILSHNHIDEPTNNVIDWLHYYNADYKRLNGDEYSPSSNFTLDLTKNNLIKNNTSPLSPEDISVVWYRRWIKPLVRSVDFDNYKKNNYTEHEILLIESYQAFLKDELSAYTNGIFSLFSSKLWIPEVQLSRGKLNKIDVLIKAKKIGLLIPETIITSSKDELINFCKKNDSLITKPIFEVAPMIYKNTPTNMYTATVEMADIDSFPELFYPSLFQKKIDKSFEIRVFVYKKKIFSMAIFSQTDDQTKSDFRKYNLEKPNRNIPFKLPDLIKDKLLKLMKKVKLNTGSIDMILTNNNEFIFLEINPVGQFGMVSLGGNYFLDKIIAEDLIKTDNNYVKKQQIKKN